MIRNHQDSLTTLPPPVTDWDESRLAADACDRATLVAQAHVDAPLDTERARAPVGAFADVVRGAPD